MFLQYNKAGLLLLVFAGLSNHMKISVFFARVSGLE